MVEKRIGQLLSVLRPLSMFAIIIQHAVCHGNHFGIAGSRGGIRDGAPALQITVPRPVNRLHPLCMQIELRRRRQVLKPQPARKTDSVFCKKRPPPEFVDRVHRRKEKYDLKLL